MTKRTLVRLALLAVSVSAALRDGLRPGRSRDAARHRPRHAGRARRGRQRDGGRDPDEHLALRGHERQRQLRVREHEGRALPRRGRAHGLQEGLARRRRGEGELHHPRRRRARGRRDGGEGRGRPGDAGAPDRPRRHGPHDRGLPGPADAARPQPQLPDAVGHRAGNGDDDAPPFPVLQPAGQPGDEVQRPVAPIEQRPGGRARQQPQDRPAHRLHPFRRGDRLGQRQHLQLRSRVRPRRRLGDDGRAQVRHQPAQGQRLLLRQHRGDAGQELLRVGHREEAGDEVPAVRRHARRTGHQGQALLLRRLPAHGRQSRRAAPRGDPADRVAQRRLLDGRDDHLRSRHREPRRHGTPAVPGQRDSHEPAEPGRAQHPRRSCRSRTCREPASAR